MAPDQREQLAQHRVHELVDRQAKHDTHRVGTGSESLQHLVQQTLDAVERHDTNRRRMLCFAQIVERRQYTIEQQREACMVVCPRDG